MALGMINGRRLRVKDLMSGTPVTALDSESVNDAREKMRKHGIRHLPVVDSGGKLSGLFTEHDLLDISVSRLADIPKHEAAEIYSGIRLRDVMKTQVVSVEPELPLRDASRIMYESKFGCVPVVESGRLVGILTKADFLKLMLRERPSPFRSAMGRFRRARGPYQESP